MYPCSLKDEPWSCNYAETRVRRGARSARVFPVLLFFLLAAFLIGHGVCHAGMPADEPVDYGCEENWAYFEQDAIGKAVDVFFVCPTVFRGDEDHCNMDLADGETRRKFLGATNMEKGIYDRCARFFAPYYRMAGFATHRLSKERRESCVNLAYRDVREAFLFYLEHEGAGRPFLLAGFSQGSNHILQLLKEFGGREDVQTFLVAAYCPGWILTPEDILEYPHLAPAKHKDDTGVIISFNTEAEDVTDSPIVPAGVTSISINPLSWRTDHAVADKILNLGACFTGYDGEIKREIPALTGAYLDRRRGTLKVTDVTPEDYPPRLSDYPRGVYHIYDYQFFYRNLQENVALRIAAWQKSHHGAR